MFALTRRLCLLLTCFADIHFLLSGRTTFAFPYSMTLSPTLPLGFHSHSSSSSSSIVSRLSSLLLSLPSTPPHDISLLPLFPSSNSHTTVSSPPPTERLLEGDRIIRVHFPVVASTHFWARQSASSLVESLPNSPPLGQESGTGGCCLGYPREGINGISSSFFLSGWTPLLVTATDQTSAVGSRLSTPPPRRPSPGYSPSSLSSSSPPPSKKWIFRAGNVGISLLLPFPSPSFAFLVPQAVTVAITRTLLGLDLPGVGTKTQRREEKCRRKKVHEGNHPTQEDYKSEESEDDEEHRIGIKWVNDVFIGGKKIAGVLVEMPGISTRSPSEDPLLLLSVGFNRNLNDDALQLINQPAISLYQIVVNNSKQSTNHTNLSHVDLPSVDYFLSSFTYEILASIRRLISCGFQPYFQDFLNNHLAFKGCMIEMENPSVFGKLEGVGEKGQLLLRRDTRGVATRGRERMEEGRITGQWRTQGRGTKGDDIIRQTNLEEFVTGSIIRVENEHRNLIWEKRQVEL